MEWPAPSLRPSRLIDTPPAWPVITTWKDSNSFFAAAIFAAAVAPAGGCALGRIFSAAGANQTLACLAWVRRRVLTMGPSTSAEAHCPLLCDVDQPSSRSEDERAVQA